MNKANPPRKTKPKGRHPDKAMSAAFVRTAPPGRHADGNGLYLFVQPSGTRSWIQAAGGHPGSAPRARTRQRHVGLPRRGAREGAGQPQAGPRGWRPACREASCAGREWILTFERYAFPRIGKMPISEVTSADVIGILAPIWHDMPPSARKLLQRIRGVMAWAVAMGLRPDNPCDRTGLVLGPQGDLVRHMRALPHREVYVADRDGAGVECAAGCEAGVRVPGADGTGTRKC